MKTVSSSLLSVIIMFSSLKFSQSQKTTADYCKISPEHTMCIYPKGQVGPACPPESKLNPLSERDKGILLKRHNAFRSDIARGERVKFHCPSGADIMHVEWDTELANIAQRWSIQCKPGSDKQRNVDRFEVGQNTNIMSSPNETVQPDLEGVLQIWYDEYLNMTDEIFKGKTFKNCEHFTQIVWGNTRLLGCASHTWTISGKTTRNLICNYGPKGNIIGQRLYTPGKQCSKCPPNHECTTEDDHDGLCSHGLFDGGITLQRNSQMQLIILGLITVFLIQNYQ